VLRGLRGLRDPRIFVRQEVSELQGLRFSVTCFATWPGAPCVACGESEERRGAAWAWDARRRTPPAGVEMGRAAAASDAGDPASPSPTLCVRGCSGVSASARPRSRSGVPPSSTQSASSASVAVLVGFRVKGL
jgi:hypothetical protein